MWMVDPATREPLPAIDTDREYLERIQRLIDAGNHWRKGWRTGIERDEAGRPLRMWFRQCAGPCCTRAPEKSP